MRCTYTSAVSALRFALTYVRACVPACAQMSESIALRLRGYITQTHIHTLKLSQTVRAFTKDSRIAARVPSDGGAAPVQVYTASDRRVFVMCIFISTISI